MRWIRKICLWMAACLLIGAPGMAQWQWIEEPTPAKELRLDGICIGIDAGHQARQNTQREPVAPGSDETKAKVASGTAGVRTGRAEYELNLEAALLLKEALLELGCEVVMARESNDVDISNVERALMMNEAGCDLVLRLHCNGSTNSKVSGIGLYVTKTGTIAEASYAAAEALLPAMTEATGARADGIFKRDTYSGLNWSTVPSILVEMGYMSNPEEDEKLCDPEYQQKLVDGMVNGICAYFER